MWNSSRKLNVFIVSFNLLLLNACKPEVAALPATLHVIFMSSLLLLSQQCIPLHSNMLRTDIKRSRFPRGRNHVENRARRYIRGKKIQERKKKKSNLCLIFIYWGQNLPESRKSPAFFCHINDHCTDPLATLFKMSYTRARTYIFIGCMAAGAGQIHAIHIRGKICIFIERAQLDYSNLFWILERTESSRTQGNVQTAVGVTLVSQTRET